MPDPSSTNDPLAAFGPNEWLVDELYEQYQSDKNSVDKAWWPFFEDYQPQGSGAGNGAGSNGSAKDGTAPARAATATAAPTQPAPAQAATQPAARPLAQPGSAAQAPATTSGTTTDKPDAATDPAVADKPDD